jgi:hypothetical protein
MRRNMALSHKRFLLNIHDRPTNGQMIAGPVYAIEGDTLAEVLSKLPLLIKEIVEKDVKEQMALNYGVMDDDIPF